MTASNRIQPAASLILFRERTSPLPEILMVRRGDALGFAAGAYVFPGGRVDPADVASARAIAAVDVDDGAARIAAIRETAEETGIADAAAIGDLVLFARWQPPLSVSRRFDTRFYVARIREDAPLPVADGVERSAAFWASAQAVLDACDAGRGRVIFPTRRMLERLAQLASFAEACAQAARLPERIIAPWVEERADGGWLCIPAGAGYPITEEPLTTAIRG